MMMIIRRFGKGRSSRQEDFAKYQVDKQDHDDVDDMPG